MSYVVSSLGVMCRYVITFQRTKIQNTRTHNNIALIKLVHTLASSTTRHHPHNQHTHHTLTSLLALTQINTHAYCMPHIVSTVITGSEYYWELPSAINHYYCLRATIKSTTTAYQQLRITTRSQQKGQLHHSLCS